MPTLVLLRHAKSRYPEGVEDHDRPLSERGLREAPIAGRMIAERVPVVDLALVSTAVRAQQTWQAVASSVSPRLLEDRADLYLATVHELTELVRGLPSDATVVMLVGHNEGLEELAADLSGAPVTLKTSTFAILGSATPWHSWSSRSARLHEVVVAR